MTRPRPSSGAIRAPKITQPRVGDRVERDHAAPWYLYATHIDRPSAFHVARAGDTRIGREATEQIDLVLPDPAVSRLHAVFSLYGGSDVAWLQDCGSSNGVFINGRRTDGGAVRPGDVVRLGDTTIIAGRGTPAAPDETYELGLLGQAPCIGELRDIVRKVAPSALSVLIVGATGTGKEVVAAALHAESRRSGRFVAVNCAALPSTLVESVLFGHRKGAFTGAVADHDGAFVQAHGGTLLLDEVGDLALEAQPKLLRALESGRVTPVGATSAIEVDVRVVAATHVPLDAAMQDGRFRHDLYARLAGVVLKTPTLAERREDILLLFRFFLGPDSAREISADFLESLHLHSWPFNVRELRKLSERLLVLHGNVSRWERGMLPDEMHMPASRADESPPMGRPPSVAPEAKISTDAIASSRERPPARDELVALLEGCGGNVSRAAALVGRNRKQVYRWMELYGIAHGTGRRG